MVYSFVNTTMALSPDPSLARRSRRKSAADNRIVAVSPTV
jgi:hypothetical protein